MKEFKAQFKGKQFSGMFKYWTEQVQVELRDKNPLQRFRSAESHLLDLTFFRHAFEYREARLLRDLVNRLRQSTAPKGGVQGGGGLSAFDAWNEACDEVQSLAKAHIDRAMIEQLEATLEACDVGCRPMLHLLGSLFALHKIDAHAGWYLQQSYFSVKKSRAIHAEIARLCRALRPHVAELIAAFGIDEALIDAPIAQGMQGLVEANAYGRVMGYQ